MVHMTGHVHVLEAYLYRGHGTRQHHVMGLSITLNTVMLLGSRS